MPFIHTSQITRFRTPPERLQIFICRKNKEYIKNGIFLHLELWEDFLDAISQTRLQDEYNKAIAECDVFVSLFHTKVGQYTEEEFLKALETFQANQRPLIYTYFKDSPISLSKITPEIKSLLDFKEKLNKLGHFYRTYKDINELKFLFDQQLNKFLPELRDNFPSPQTSCQGYRPPPVTGYIYIVVQKNLKSQKLLKFKIEWGEWNPEQEAIEIAQGKGIVLRLLHRKADTIPLKFTTDGQILEIQQYQNGQAPQQWTDPQYLQVER